MDQNRIDAVRRFLDELYDDLIYANENGLIDDLAVITSDIRHYRDELRELGDLM